MTDNKNEQPVLNIAVFSKLSAQRAETGFKTYRNVPITYWTTALMGEGGELCNMIKKIERVSHGGIDGGSSYTAASLSKTDLAEEIGGIFIYLNILSGLLDIDMEAAIIETFNSKSEKYGFPEKYHAKEEHTPEQPDHSGKVTEKVLTDKNTAEQPVGEIPEEIMTWINKTAGMKDEYDNAVDVATELMIATYRKLQPEIEVLKDLVAGYEDWAKDVRLLTKEIDVILCGKNAAEQASLCDLIGPIAALTAERDEYRKALETLLKYLQIEVDRNFIRCILDKYPSTP